MEEKKLCPFRRKADGEFAECYGERCMAYYEYDVTPYSPFEKTHMQQTQRCAVCKMMPPPAIPSYPVACGCA